MSRYRYVVVVLAMLLGSIGAYGQPMESSGVCDEGWAIPPRVDPRDRNIHCMNYWGVMRGWFTNCEGARRGEEYAIRFMALGDLNGDNIADWGVQRNRCDTSINGQTPVEWLVYHGVRGGLPDARSGQRIGPSELGAKTRILCSGDWDGDGHRDLAVRIELFGDTTGGNTERYETARLIIFWGSKSGEYSLSDTSDIPCEATIWLGLRSGAGVDFDGDGVDDLFIWGHSGFDNGVVMQLPSFRILRGGIGKRWGRNGASSKADWTWWASSLQYNRLRSGIDQDCDGNRDIVLYYDERVGTGHVSVLYGRAGQLPDTSEVETVDLLYSNGHFSTFADLTGDKVPELAINCGSQEIIKVYAGSPGRRLKAQYGDGLQPWAEVALPLKIHDGWYASGFVPFLELGDGDRDGYDDLWLLSPPFVLGYSGWGRYLDWQIDMAFRWGAVLDAGRLGDIDGSGVASFAVSFGGVPGGMAIFKGTDSASHLGISRRLPHAATEVCLHSASAERGSRSEPWLPVASLSVVPNPVAGAVVVQWDHLGVDTPVRLTVVDAGGREVYRRDLPGHESRHVIPGDLVPGVYMVMVRSGERIISSKVVIRP